jgi:hypothetical protein
MGGRCWKGLAKGNEWGPSGPSRSGQLLAGSSMQLAWRWHGRVRLYIHLFSAPLKKRFSFSTSYIFPSLLACPLFPLFGLPPSCWFLSILGIDGETLTMARLTRLMILLFTLCYGPAILVLNGLVSAASTGPSGDARTPTSTRSSLAIAAWEMRAMDKLMEEIRRRQEVRRKLFLYFIGLNLFLVRWGW